MLKFMSNKENLHKISFILPIYNVEIFLRKCLDSIVNQTIKNWEAILIDDGSTDSSPNICIQYTARDSRFKYVRKENNGQGSARNLGMRLAQGEYICFIDPDDWINKETTKELLSLMESSNADFINFGLQFITENDVIIRTFNKYKKKEMKGREIFECAMLDKEIYTSPCNKIYNKSFLIQNNIIFPEIRAYEDVLFSRKLSFFAQKCIFTNNIYYNALVRNGSTSRNININNFKIATELIELERTFITSIDSKSSNMILFNEHIQKFTAYLIFQAAFRIKSNEQFKSCIKILKTAGIYNYSYKYLFSNRLTIFNKIIIYISRKQLLLRLTVRVSSFFRFKPY